MGLLEKLVLSSALASTPQMESAPYVEEMRSELVEVQQRLREQVAANCPEPLESFILEDSLSQSEEGWVLTTAIPLENFDVLEAACIRGEALSLQWTSNSDLKELGINQKQIPVNINLSIAYSEDECGYVRESGDQPSCVVLRNEDVFDGVWERIEQELLSTLPDGVEMEVKNLGDRSKRLRFFESGRKLFTIKVLVPKGTEPGVYTRRIEDGEDFVKIKSPDLKRDFYVSPKDAVETELRKAGF